MGVTLKKCSKCGLSRPVFVTVNLALPFCSPTCWEGYFRARPEKRARA